MEIVSSGPRPAAGSLFVFSGIDGAGKTTQIERVERALADRGVATRRVWARGGYTPLFSLLKAILRRLRRGALPPPGRSVQRDTLLRAGWRRNLWLTIALLDLALYYAVWVRALRWAGITVLSDRYLLDTELDFRLNFPAEKVAEWRLWHWLQWAAPRPDGAFMFLVPVEESLARSAAKNEPFPDSPEVLAERWRVYDAACRRGDYRRFDGTQPREKLTADLLDAMAVRRSPVL